jgi:hypothetical protein
MPIVIAGPLSSEFGASVASAGDLNGDGFGDVIVGAPEADDAYVYWGSAAGLSLGPTVLHSPSSRAGFGAAVSTAGDVNGDGFCDAIIGGPDVDRAYVYLGAAMNFGSSAPIVLSPPGGSTGASTVAASVAGVGDVNGDRFEDVLVSSTSSVAYLYLGGPSGPSALPSVLSGVARSSFGRLVSTAGDVNGDGLTDFILASSSSPAAYLYLGRAGSVPTSGSSMNLPSSGYVTSTTAGDVNGDGFGDVVVGARLQNAAYLYLGTATGLPIVPTMIVRPMGVGQFGWSVAIAGDVDGDSKSELVVGDPSVNRAFVFFGNYDGVEAFSHELLAPTGVAGFGQSIAQLIDGVVRSRKLCIPSTRGS